MISRMLQVRSSRGSAPEPKGVRRVIGSDPDVHPAFFTLSWRLGPSSPNSMLPMRTFTAVVERDSVTGLYVGYVPGFPGAHTQAATLDELDENLREVIELLLEEGEPKLEGEFVGTHTVTVAA